MSGLSVREAAERSRKLYVKGYTMGERGFVSREAKEMVSTVRPLSLNAALATTMYEELTPAAKAAVDAELAESVRQLREFRVRKDTKRNATRRKLNATRGVVTRTKNRLKNGVCPCCNRYFRQLHQHMTTEHPDFATSEIE